MKVKLVSNMNDDYHPVTIQITMETLGEFSSVYHRMNRHFTDVYDDKYIKCYLHNSIAVPSKEDDMKVSGEVWELLDNIRNAGSL